MIAVEPMNSIDQVKQLLIDEFESGETPDIADYVRRFPKYRRALLDFWVILASSDRLSDLNLDKSDRDPLTEGEEEIVRDLCLALSIGPQWLEDAVDQQERAVASVGAELRRIRKTPYEFGGTANRSWQRIVVYGWLAHMAANPDGTVSRLELQKLAYLLENAMGLGIFTKHKKHQLGPYDPTATYRDAEPKCVAKGYLVPDGRYDLKIGPQIDEALAYAGRYLRESAVAEAFLQVLRELKIDKWELETLATVHAVVASWSADEISTAAVRAALAADKTWSKKLRRSNFTSARIDKSLDTLSRLRLIDLESTHGE